MKLKEFLHTKCSACGGDWTSMLLTGIKEMAKTDPKWKEEYDKLPEVIHFEDAFDLVERLLEKDES